MFSDILRSARDNIKRFAILWLLTLFANQLFVFGACFAPHCLAEAVPHTLVLAALINFFALPAQSRERATLRAQAESKSPNPDAFRDGDKRRSFVPLLALAVIGLAVAFFLVMRVERVPEPNAGHHQTLPSVPFANPSPIASAEPPTGRDLTLREKQLHHCVAQGIRLEGIRELAVLDTAEKRARFKALLDDYDMRCAAHLSPSNALEVAIMAVEPHRRALKFEGLRAISDAEPER
jgi:hypothetical protein